VEPGYFNTDDGIVLDARKAGMDSVSEVFFNLIESIFNHSFRLKCFMEIKI